MGGVSDVCEKTRRMKIVIVTRTTADRPNGNWITAARWAGILRKFGHRVRLANHYRGEDCDLLIALHAYHSYPAIRTFRRFFPARPLVVALTGTDLYRYAKISPIPHRSMRLADRLILLQERGLKAIPVPFRRKARVIYQSSRRSGRGTPSRPVRKGGAFQVAVIGNLRWEKDPFRAAFAARSLPAASRIRIVQVGRALDDRMRRKAVAESGRNPRYRWIGERTHSETMWIIQRSDLVAITSLMEGSSNVLCEAIAAKVPVVASRIPGLMGTLGVSCPGYFPVGDTGRLASLLRKCETDREFLAKLRIWIGSLHSLVHPDRERRAWRDLLRELGSV